MEHHHIGPWIGRRADDDVTLNRWSPSRARVYKRKRPKGHDVVFGRENAFEETLWSFDCSASWKADELSAIESAVTVIISELPSVCVSRSEVLLLLVILACSCC
ncbi:hypothetical protein AVEN_187532-1 [Araneus ventricosus]|uniref:Uncharacterized protein n=1 Tax=Araneus ventricosus TaxID=182803 RepID=A0A4Y2BSJ0_ARAVE|nr:hypothetical protein AVEN_187532-1 [Araneus ventricosus]